MAIETIAITNFTGALTRNKNGDIKSGLAKFNTSFGYDPFTKPGQLTWLEQPTSIASAVTDTILVGKTRSEGAGQIVYGVGSNRFVYRILANNVTNPNIDSVIGIGSVAANSPSFNFGASLDFYGTPERMYVSSDGQINSFPISSVITGAFAGDAVVGSAANYVSNTFHPLKAFQGKLVFGNGPTIGVIDSTNTITSSVIGIAIGSGGTTKSVYSNLVPPLPPETNIQDLDITPNYEYLLMTASDIAPENIMTVASDRQVSTSSNGNLFQWNGVDEATTAGTSIPSQALTALQTYLQTSLVFGNDAFGTALGSTSEKLLMLPNNKSPLPNATGVNGNFIYWMSVEADETNNDLYGSLYYFGNLDKDSLPGLYRILRFTTSLSNGYVYQTPFCLIVNNKYSTLNNALTSVIPFGYGKHYFSTLEVNASTTQNKLYRFLVTSTGSGTPQSGVYETQNQLFSKKISIKQIRVYTEPMVTGNGFRLDLIDSDGSIPTNGTFTYTFASGSEPTLLQGALERINFNPTCKDFYSVGLRITNTGSTNMTINKIEIDWEESGK